MPAGTPLEQTAARAARNGRLPGDRARGHRLPGLCRHGRADQLQRPGAPVLPAQSAASWATSRSTWSTSTTAADQSHEIALRVRPSAAKRSPSARAPTLKVVEVPPGPPVLSPIVAEIYGPDYAGADRRWRSRCATISQTTPDIVGVDDSGDRSRAEAACCTSMQSKAALLGVRAARHRRRDPRRAWPARMSRSLHDADAKYAAPVRHRLPAETAGRHRRRCCN